MLDQAWTLLRERYIGNTLFRTNKIFPLPLATPARVFAWARAYFHTDTQISSRKHRRLLNKNPKDINYERRQYRTQSNN